MSQYFIGDRATGTVRGEAPIVVASSVTTWKDLVFVHLGNAITLNIKRATFLALEKKERDKIKHVQYLVPACFRTSPAPREMKQATHCNLIFLDIDTMEDGSSPAAPFVSNPQSLQKALEGLNFAAYETASSTPEKPRIRVVVDAKSIPVADYSDAVCTIAARMGLPVVTKESRVTVQPMFLPTLFTDSNGKDDHPLFHYTLDGRPFEVSDIQKSDTPRPARKTYTPDDSDGLEYLRAPIYEVTLNVAREVLHFLDPDCDYFKWIEVAAALKHQFLSDEKAYQLFDEWSSGELWKEGCSKYTNSDDTRKKWDSYLENPSHQIPVTIRSLLYRSVSGGWDSGKVKEECFKSTEAAIHTSKTLGDATVHGLKKILATPMLSYSEEDSLLQAIVMTVRDKFSVKVTKAALKKDLERLKSEERKKETNGKAKKDQPLWAVDLIYVSGQNMFFSSARNESYTGDSIDAQFGRELLPSEETLISMGLPVTEAALSRPIVRPRDYVLNHLKVPLAYDFCYDPSNPSVVIDDPLAGHTLVNSYRITYPQSDLQTARACGELFQKHLEVLIAEPEHRKTVTDWIAYIVQNPGKKIRWAILLQGAEGAGKTFLADCLRWVLGHEHVFVVDKQALNKGWNEWSVDRQVIAFEEIRIGGRNKTELMDMIKPLITNDYVAVNKRREDTRQKRNIVNYLLFSNHHDALSITPTDRRYFVIKSLIQTKEQVLALKDHFPRLYSYLSSHKGGLRAYFEGVTISPQFEPDGPAPSTRYVEELIQDSASDETAAVRRLIQEADTPLIQSDILSSTVLLTAMHLEGMNRMNAQWLSNVLREEGYVKYGRFTIGEERHYLWSKRGVNPSTIATVARERFAFDINSLF